MSPGDARRSAAFLAPARRPATTRTVKIRRWQPYRNPAGNMLGYLAVELPSGLVLNDCKLMIGPSGKPWIAMPSVKQFNKDGTPRLDANGRQTYSQTVEFIDHSTAARFRDLVLEALHLAHPEALDEDLR